MPETYLGKNRFRSEEQERTLYTKDDKQPS
jgi:hypothetical protein